MPRLPVAVAVTGASGAIYGRAVVRTLTERGHPVDLVLSKAGLRVAHHELGDSWWEGVTGVTRHPVEDVGATIASGSYPVQGMIVAPCSVGTASRIASGLSSNLIERAAEVQFKERRPLALLVRESPLSLIQLENLTRLARSGATVLPAAPGFYGHPKSIDDLVQFMVERALQAIGLREEGHLTWDGKTGGEGAPA